MGVCLSGWLALLPKFHMKAENVLIIAKLRMAGVPLLVISSQVSNTGTEAAENSPDCPPPFALSEISSWPRFVLCRH